MKSAHNTFHLYRYQPTAVSRTYDDTFSMKSAHITSAMADLRSNYQTTGDLLGSINNFSTQPSVLTPLPPKQSDPSFIVGLQQVNGSWLLNDQLAGAMSKSVQELKKCCPVSCDVTTIANIWVTLVVLEFLKKKYSSMMDELELAIMKAEQWLHYLLVQS